MKIKFFLFLFSVLHPFMLSAQGLWNSSAIRSWTYDLNAQNGYFSAPTSESFALVSVGTDGRLQYRTYANEGETNAVNIIPDFSTCGYKKGGVALPLITDIKKTLYPVVNNGDNTAQIQDAITEVGNYTADINGFKGVILLKSGTYPLSDTLLMNQSGVILRGEGQGSGGTVLMANKPAQHTLITVKGVGTGLGSDPSSGRKNITDTYVACGTKSFTVASVSGLSVGTTIVIVKTPNQAWIDVLQMAQYGWTASGYALRYERVITNITGNTITIDAPIVDPIESTYGGGYIYVANVTGRVANCGIENLRLESKYNLTDLEDEQHGWKAIRLLRVENCWVKRVTAKNFGNTCVSVGQRSRYNTIEECAMLDPISITTGGRRYSFEIEPEEGASFNLFQRCYTRGGRHDFVTGARITGPNAFLDGYSENTYADVGPHQRWATGILYDNIKCGEIRIQNRKDLGSGHGWAGAQNLFWRCVSTTATIKVESPIGGKNWSIGSSGLREGTGYWENHGYTITPRSLYLSQLQDRKGSVSVSAITTPAQRDGTIYELLKSWAGEGDLPAK